MGSKPNPKPNKRKPPPRTHPHPHAKPKPKPTPPTTKPPLKTPPHHHHHQHNQQHHHPPTIPFHPHDRILLVGEGDLSFAHALLATHHCARLLPTTFDSRAEVLAKYPQAAATMAVLEGRGVRVLCGVDAGLLGRGGAGGGREVRGGWRGVGMGRGRGRGGRGGGVEGVGEEDQEEEEEEDDGDGDGEVDGAEKGGERGLRSAAGAGWDKIVFNFPHVGGKTKDVNRQVRYNQELLVSFFKAAMPLLAAPTPTPTPTPDPATSASAIIVTLFESEPYTLWNIRDLARHVGLKVGRSFKFQAAAYPGYRHARTLGNVDGVVGGGAWRGEERAARTYVFEVDGGDGAGGRGHGEGGGLKRQEGKRKRGESEDDEDD